MRRELREWRRKRRSEEAYKRRKLEYKELCIKKEENEKWEKRAMEVKRENEVWDIVNKERRRRKRK